MTVRGEYVFDNAQSIILSLFQYRDDLREHLKNAPKKIMAQQQQESSDSSSDDSSSDSSSEGG